MIPLIITIAAYIVTILLFILSEHKEDIYDELYEKSNSKK